MLPAKMTENSKPFDIPQKSGRMRGNGCRPGSARTELRGDVGLLAKILGDTIRFA
jgi:hypothetical protein